MTKIKEWKYDDMMSKVCAYGDLWMSFDFIRDHEKFDTVKVEEGFVTLTSRVEILKETPKAYQLRVADSWTEWFPKSAIVFA